MDNEGMTMSENGQSPPATGGNNMGPLYTALAKAQAEFPAIPRTRTVTVRSDKGSYQFAYAPLDVILSATREPLSKHELAITQPFRPGEVITKLVHSSGAEIESRWRVPETDRMQQLGSALTYIRRYQVTGILGLASEEDDDANAADGNAITHREDHEPRRAERTEPATPHGATKITNVEHKTGKNKNTGKAWQRWDVEFEDGRKASTFRQEIAGLAQRIHAAGVLVTPVIESPDGRNQNLMGLETDGEVPTSEEPPFWYQGMGDDGGKSPAAPDEKDRAPLMKRVKALEIERRLTPDEKKELGRTIIGAGFSLATAPIPNLVSFVEFLEQPEAVAAWRQAQAKGAA